MDPASSLMSALENRIANITSQAGTMIGGIGSSIYNNKYRKYLDGMKRKNQMWFDKEYNTNYLDTDEAKSYLRNMVDQVKTAAKDQDSKGAITGASAEKSVAMKDRMGENYNRSVTNLAGFGTRRKDRAMDKFMDKDGQIDVLKLSNIMQQSQNWNQFAQNAQGAGQNMLMSNTSGEESGGDIFGLLGSLLKKKQGNSLSPSLTEWGSGGGFMG